MPRRVRRRRKSDHRQSPWVMERLLSGHSMAFLPGTEDEEELPGLWESQRDEILAAWIRENPGTRPAAWWSFDAPGPRRQIGGGPTAFETGCPEWSRRLRFGIPSVWTGPQFDDPPRFETQGAYLTRHKLLAAGEQVPPNQDAGDLYARASTTSDRVALDEGYVFDEWSASYVMRFFCGFLRQTIGRWKGEPFVPLAWQRDQILRPMFGWKTPAGLRRFRRAFVFIPKKNGKSTLCAGLILCLATDGEAAAEVYGAAVDSTQSDIIYRECSRMAEASPELGIRAVATKKILRCGDSFYKALSGESASSEGMNIYGMVADELHAWTTPTLRELWGSLYYGGSARTQPLAIVITTAGEDDPDALWIEEYQSAKAVLEGSRIDLRMLAFIAEAGEKDDWTDPAVHAKANPSYGVTIDPEEMKAACGEAKLSPTKRALFLRYRLNRPTSKVMDHLVDLDVWDRCGQEAPDDPTLEWDAGLDLAAVDDFNAFSLVTRISGSTTAAATGDAGEVVPAEAEDLYYWKVWLWIPEDTVRRRVNDGLMSFRQWADQGLIEVVPGPIVRPSYIRQRIVEIGQQYRLREIGFDPWAAFETAASLQDDHGLVVVPLRQGMQTLSPPSKKLQRLLLMNRIHHGGHPVLRWMFKNCRWLTDENENIRPVKPAHKSPLKIDGIVSGIMALHRAMARPAVASVYEQRGVLVL